MQHIFDIHDYDENFAERFCSHTIPIYDLWSVRPLQNQMKEIICGTAEEVEKFRNFLVDHSNKDYPHELVIVIGNSEKGNPGNMLNSTKKYFKLRFDKYKGNDLGQPLFLGGVQQYPTGNEQMIPLGFPSVPGNRIQGAPGMPGMPGISYTEIQGIIDRNVTDASRSIRAEYEENLAKREAESIKRIAELEMKMELYKLDLRAREIEEKERRLQDELDDFEERKAEGLGSVKEYTKTIAGGLLELGKSAFGIDEIESRVSKAKKEKSGSNEEKSEKHQNLRGSGSFDDSSFTKVSNDRDGFSAKSDTNKQNLENDGNEDAFSELLGVIQTLSVEQRMQLMDVLIPEESSFADVSTDKDLQTNQNIEKNEDLQSDDND